MCSQDEGRSCTPKWALCPSPRGSYKRPGGQPVSLRAQPQAGSGPSLHCSIPDLALELGLRSEVKMEDSRASGPANPSCMASSDPLTPVSNPSVKWGQLAYLTGETSSWYTEQVFNKGEGDLSFVQWEVQGYRPETGLGGRGALRCLQGGAVAQLWQPATCRVLVRGASQLPTAPTAARAQLRESSRHGFLTGVTAPASPPPALRVTGTTGCWGFSVLTEGMTWGSMCGSRWTVGRASHSAGPGPCAAHNPPGA